MLNKIKISDNIYFVISFDEHCYKDVLEDFKSAEYIKIVTFSIINSKDTYKKLLELIVDTNADIEIITNIPNTYGKYIGNKSKEKVENYRKKLFSYIPSGTNYSHYAVHAVDINFNLCNHSKIIMTNNIAYVGSANFTFESKNNFETGILIYDIDSINNIKENVIPILRKKCIGYWGKHKEEFEKVDMLLSLSYSIVETLSITTDNILYELRDLNKYGYEPSVYFEEHSEKFTLKSLTEDLDNMFSATQDSADFIEENKEGIFLEIFKLSDIENLLDEFIELLKFYKNSIQDNECINFKKIDLLKIKEFNFNKSISVIIESSKKHLEDMLNRGI